MAGKRSKGGDKRPRRRGDKRPRKRAYRTPNQGTIANLLLEQLAANGIYADLESLSEDTIERRYIGGPAKTELWHYYYIGFEDGLDFDTTAELIHSCHSILRQHYRRKTIIGIKVGQENDKGELIAKDNWKRVSSRLDIDSAFTQVDFNIEEWLTKSNYQAAYGISFELQTPQWYERKKAR